MDELKGAITAVEIVFALALAMLLGDYLGHRIGRRRLATIAILVALASVVVFAVYAAIVLA